MRNHATKINPTRALLFVHESAGSSLWYCDKWSRWHARIYDERPIRWTTGDVSLWQMQTRARTAIYSTHLCPDSRWRSLHTILITWFAWLLLLMDQPAQVWSADVIIQIIAVICMLFVWTAKSGLLLSTASCENKVLHTMREYTVWVQQYPVKHASHWLFSNCKCGPVRGYNILLRSRPAFGYSIPKLPSDTGRVKCDSLL